jgi:hypothetical protein
MPEQLVRMVATVRLADRGIEICREKAGGAYGWLLRMVR